VGSATQARKSSPSSPWDASKRRARVDQRERLSRLERGNGNQSMADRLQICEQRSWAYDALGEHNADGLPRVAVIRADETQCSLVRHCDHRVCDWCKHRRAAKLMGTLVPKILQVFECRKPALLTFTQKDLPRESMEHASKRLLDAFNRLRKHNKRFKKLVRAGLITYEVTYNKEKGSLHAHLHVLADLVWYDQKELLHDWRLALGVDPCGKIGGARIERVKGSDGKDLEGAEAVQAAVQEVVKYVAKGIDVDSMTDVQLSELLSWLRRRRLLRPFGKLHGVKLDDQDGEAEEMTDEQRQQKEWEDAGYVGCNKETGELRRMDECTYREDDGAHRVGYGTFNRHWWRTYYKKLDGKISDEPRFERKRRPP